MRDGESRRWSSTPSGLPNTSIPMGTRLRLRVGQRARRVSTPACVGTIRFVGEVEGRAGSWVGIEWDDLGAGEMNGELSDGRLVFKVSERGKRSRTCASLCRESDLAASGAPLHHPFCLRPDAEAAFSDFCGRPTGPGFSGPPEVVGQFVERSGRGICLVWDQVGQRQPGLKPEGIF